MIKYLETRLRLYKKMRTIITVIVVIACVLGILYLMTGNFDDNEMLDKLFNLTAGMGDKIINVFKMPATSLKLK